MGVEIILNRRVGSREPCCDTITLTRGVEATIRVRLQTVEGFAYIIASGDVFALSIGAVASAGDTVLQLSTDDPDEGEAVPGASEIEFYVSETDSGTTLALPAYASDIFLTEPELTPCGGSCGVLMEGKVHESA